MIFVDTSAFLALLDSADKNHTRASKAWATLYARNEPLATSNYVVLETMALAQRRLGMKAVHVCQTIFFPLVEILWVEASLHHRATAVLLAIAARDLSLVDCVSFEVMRERRLDTAFVFDQHFARQGFHCLTGAE